MEILEKNPVRIVKGKNMNVTQIFKMMFKMQDEEIFQIANRNSRFDALVKSATTTADNTMVDDSTIIVEHKSRTYYVWERPSMILEYDKLLALSISKALMDSPAILLVVDYLDVVLVFQLMGDTALYQWENLLTRKNNQSDEKVNKKVTMIPIDNAAFVFSKKNNERCSIDQLKKYVRLKQAEKNNPEEKEKFIQDFKRKHEQYHRTLEWS